MKAFWAKRRNKTPKADDVDVKVTPDEEVPPLEPTPVQTKPMPSAAESDEEGEEGDEEEGDEEDEEGDEEDESSSGESESSEGSSESESGSGSSATESTGDEEGSATSTSSGSTASDSDAEDEDRTVYGSEDMSELEEEYNKHLRRPAPLSAIDEESEEEEEDEENLSQEMDSNEGKEEGESDKVIMEILSNAEKTRFRKLFCHVNTYYGQGKGGDGLDFSQFIVALSLLGQVEKYEKCKEMFQETGLDRIDEDRFVVLVGKMRMQQTSQELMNQLQDNFNAIYEGTCPTDNQRDSEGNKYITARQFRLVLTTLGDKLSDEEGDEIVDECKPTIVETADGTKEGQINFAQYRAMLLDTGR